ncbi:hypothetical protein IBTHAUMO2_1060001 [Nitrosopumilaceae archaeon]|nr:hypothetical protein [Alphaproteobacteria bacterium]CAI9830721.1 hypothetical protein IBTHAUMO2_1060001 [Nitrosopumilaceae archaeon]
MHPWRGVGARYCVAASAPVPVEDAGKSKRQVAGIGSGGDRVGVEQCRIIAGGRERRNARNILVFHDGLDRFYRVSDT